MEGSIGYRIYRTLAQCRYQRRDFAFLSVLPYCAGAGVYVEMMLTQIDTPDIPIYQNRRYWSAIGAASNRVPFADYNTPEHDWRAIVNPRSDHCISPTGFIVRMHNGTRTNALKDISIWKCFLVKFFVPRAFCSFGKDR